jgi:tetratricopeptide (TPR) repeat protein
MSQGLCPSCGAAVNLTAGQAETKCQYCQNTVTLQQAEAQFNEVKNSKFGGTLLIAETAQEGGSYAEALNYYNKVIEQEPGFADAWLNKGICMVRTSKIGDLKIPEAISSWRAAIKFAKNPDAMKKRVALEINNVVMAFFPVLEEHYHKFSEVGDAFEEHVGRFNLLDSAMALALEFNPESKATCVFQRKRTPVPIQSGHSFQLISDSCRSEATLWG